MNVPFLSLAPAYEELQPLIDAAFRRTMRLGHFVLGAEVEAFEEAFARYCGAGHCVGTGSGLDALTLTLRAWDIGAGDEVIVPGYTWVSTANVVEYQGMPAYG